MPRSYKVSITVSLANEDVHMPDFLLRDGRYALGGAGYGSVKVSFCRDECESWLTSKFLEYLRLPFVKEYSITMAEEASTPA